MLQVSWAGGAEALRILGELQLASPHLFSEPQGFAARLLCAGAGLGEVRSVMGLGWLLLRDGNASAAKSAFLTALQWELQDPWGDTTYGLAPAMAWLAVTLQEGSRDPTIMEQRVLATGLAVLLGSLLIWRRRARE